MDDKKTNPLPKWLKELNRFQPLKSQFFLYGNIYDCYYCPINYKDAVEGDKYQWVKFLDLKELLQFYFLSQGFELILYYDIVDGLEVQSSAEKLDYDGLMKYLSEQNPDAKRLVESGKQGKFKGKCDDFVALSRILTGLTDHLSVVLLNFASRFTANPNQLEEKETPLFLKLLKAAQESKVFPEKDNQRNLIVLFCDKLSDLPPWLMLENPLTKGIEIPRSSREERLSFWNCQKDLFFNNEQPADEVKGKKFMDLTDGFSNRELENLILISQREQIPVSAINEIVDLYKYGVRENFWEKLDYQTVINAEAELKKRVIGQDLAVSKSVDIIRKAKLGLHNIDQVGTKSKPKGVLFFAGPTGTGKTELAKSLAELIFSAEDALIRFDMSEFNDSNSDVKLIGAPPGYVGYDEGGQLTRRVKSRPYSIILFDEIEKAHPIVFDKFLQILDDGRLTDGKGETVYFAESLIIFTSNLGIMREDEHGKLVPNVDPQNDNYNELSDKIMHEIRNFFQAKLNRPEILNRFGDNFVVFDFIRPDNDKLILRKNLAVIQQNLLNFKRCLFEFDEDFVDLFCRHFVRDNLMMGGRGIINRIDSHLKNGITRFMFAQNRSEDLHFRVVIQTDDYDENGFPLIRFELIESDGTPAQ